MMSQHGNCRWYQIPLSRHPGILAAGIWGGGKEGWWDTTMTTMTTEGGSDKPSLGEDSATLTQWARQATTATSASWLTLSN
jgi:hypothetical protein